MLALRKAVGSASSALRKAFKPTLHFLDQLWLWSGISLIVGGLIWGFLQWVAAMALSCLVVASLSAVEPKVADGLLGLMHPELHHKENAVEYVAEVIRRETTNPYASNNFGFDRIRVMRLVLMDPVSLRQYADGFRDALRYVTDEDAQILVALFNEPQRAERMRRFFRSLNKLDRDVVDNGYQRLINEKGAQATALKHYILHEHKARRRFGDE
jgi:hypothetical protein